jgi:UDP-N-acetylglucosamine 2-epimerase
VVRALAARRDEIDHEVCVSGQHGALTDQVLEAFAISPRHRLPGPPAGLSLARVTTWILDGVATVLGQVRPDVVVVQGDTSTAMASALAAFYARAPVAHVEAGLRTGDLRHPFPEEANRRVISAVTSLHLAPTAFARDVLLSMGTPRRRILVTGNPGLDALRLATEGRLGSPSIDVPLDRGQSLVLVTAHRRESHGRVLKEICGAIAEIAGRRPELRIVFPVHPNPRVASTVRTLLSGVPNVTLINAVRYPDMVWLLQRAHLVLTDSGGLQEEGPALGKPVLVMRKRTERPEAIAAGSAILVGRDRAGIVKHVLELMEDPARYASMAIARPIYGDGHAAERIVEALARGASR